MYFKKESLYDYDDNFLLELLAVEIVSLLGRHFILVKGPKQTRCAFAPVHKGYVPFNSFLSEISSVFTSQAVV